MEKQESESLFAMASKLDESGSGKYTSLRGWKSMREMNGVKIFKRRALGLFRLRSVKSLDEMAELLHETGIAPSIEEGRKITPSLAGKSVPYSTNLYFDRELGIKRVADSEGQEMYELCVSFPSDPGL